MQVITAKPSNGYKSINFINIRVRNLKFATSKILVNFMKKMMFLYHNWYFSVQKALTYYTFNKSHHKSFILLVFSHVANFRYVANFRFLTLCEYSSVSGIDCAVFCFYLLAVCQYEGQIQTLPVASQLVHSSFQQ